MKTKALITLLLLAFTASAFADEGKVEQEMKKMSNAFREITRGVKSGVSTETLLQSVEIMKNALTAAAKETPNAVSGAPADQRKKREAIYQERLTKLQDEIGKLETAIRAGDAPKINVAIQDIRTLRGEAHTELGVDD